MTHMNQVEVIKARLGLSQSLNTDWRKEPGDTICDRNSLPRFFHARGETCKSHFLWNRTTSTSPSHPTWSYISTMVCPYKATCTLFAAIASIFYIRSTFDEGFSETSYAEDETTTSTKTKKKAMSPLRRAVTISLLIVFHIDLMFTGYLRAGVKEGIAMLKA